jgi:hypothetical protein
VRAGTSAQTIPELFSIIHGLTDLKADICFDVPIHSNWQRPVSLDDPTGVKRYAAIFPGK